MSCSIDHTHASNLQSWVSSAQGHPDFPIQNLPFGVFSPREEGPRIGIAIGDKILDLHAAVNLLPKAISAAIRQSTLNALFALPSGDRVALRQKLSTLLSDTECESSVSSMLHQANECVMHLPASIGDYTDFYVGIQHANNIGKLFRPDAPLLPNYKWVPIGYHGRASSIRTSGKTVTRPNGQRKAPDSEAPEFGPSKRLDYELEMGVWVAGGNSLGESIDIRSAGDAVAGLCLLNDWSARDIQAWEYQPLGPFLSKSFHTTISPWVVTSEALAPFKVAQPERPTEDPRPLPYLWDDEDQTNGCYAIELEVHLSTAKMRSDGVAPYRLSHGPASNMYWTVSQMIAHHTSNGCDLHPGDLLGTGTISAPDNTGYGSLIEITKGGKNPINLPSGESRTFLEDGDEVRISATASAEGYTSIGFGECCAVIAPAMFKDERRGSFVS